MNSIPVILWFRRNLRLQENLPLLAAAQTGQPVVALYIHTPHTEGLWPMGAASRWWLHHSLQALATDLHKRHLQLTIRQGAPAPVLADILSQTRARDIFAAQLPEPNDTQTQKAVEKAIAPLDAAIHWHPHDLLHHPTQLLTQSRTPYKVFTPFWRALQAQGEPPPPELAPQRVHTHAAEPPSLALEDLRLLPAVDWAKHIRASWTPGEAGAHEALEAFITEALPEYAVARDLPDRPGTSRLSPHLHFGEISPRTVWHAVRQACETIHDTHTARKAADQYLRQIAWREFAHHLLHHYPHTPNAPLRENFAAFPWRTDTHALQAWQQGRTGYPIVDAGMRELWATGWMHNRVRMIVASFLVKDLMIHWLEGARWFWDTLVDSDLANNTLGWQWVAGCGADAAPFFRIFNPVSQGRRYDPRGEYVRKWVPEISALPDDAVHAPWQAEADTLRKARVSLGRHYPQPIVDHAQARERALDAFQEIKKQ